MQKNKVVSLERIMFLVGTILQAFAGIMLLATIIFLFYSEGAAAATAFFSAIFMAVMTAFLLGSVHFSINSEEEEK